MDNPGSHVGVTRRFALELGHEVRLPLASLKTGTDLLAELAREAEIPTEWSRVLRMVQRGSDRISDVADNLFALVDLIDVRNGQRRSISTPIRVSNLVDEAVLRHQRRTESLSGRIIDRTGDEWWECEPTHMARAVYLVVGVALSRSNSGRQVVVTSAAGDTGNSVVILDGGPAIEQSRWPALTEISLPDGEGGEGHALALTVAKMAAEVHGGSMGFENTPGGVAWRLTLPVR
jgi:signal transduction histidine kinase